MEKVQVRTSAWEQASIIKTRRHNKNRQKASAHLARVSRNSNTKGDRSLGSAYSLYYLLLFLYITCVFQNDLYAPSLTSHGCGVKSEKCDWPDVGLGDVGCCCCCWVLSGSNCGLPLPRILFCVLVFLYFCIVFLYLVSCTLYFVPC